MTTSAPLNPTSPLQFTLRQLMTLTLISALVLAIIFHWGPLGFLACYLVVCTGAIIRGAFTKSSTWVAIGLVLTLPVIPFLLVAVPAIIAARDSACSVTCRSNLHQIALALQQYETDFGCYPPPFIADDTGKPMHSWRVLLLPYLDQKALHGQYRFDEPWDGPSNRKLHSTKLEVFHCPLDSGKLHATETSYVAVLGPKTVWPLEAKFQLSRPADIIDGVSNTVFVVETADSGIHWMEPRDLHINQIPMAMNPRRGQGISSHHKGGANVSFADGSVRFLDNRLLSETLRAALTRNGKDNNRLGPLLDRQ